MCDIRGSVVKLKCTCVCVCVLRVKVGECFKECKEI